MTIAFPRSTWELLVERGLELKRRLPWLPMTKPDGTLHPQQMAYDSLADIVGYGGAAGGGKTDLACGKALTRHRKTMILRRIGTEMQGIEDRLEELIGNKDGFSGQKKIWRRTRADGVKQQIEFASLPNLGDERGYQGRPHDFLVFDEAANFLEAQVRFLLGWLRSVVKEQQCQALLTFNPPTSAEGQWIISFFGPWLDRMHTNPAKPGELRWFGTVKGKDYEVADSRKFVLVDDVPTYDFDPADYVGDRKSEVITPLSRTFIPSRVTDNMHLMNTGYMAQLQALPEPLRSQMLNGDFQAGMQDSIWQVIPTAWIDAAMDRWDERLASFKGVMPEMDSMGIDVARGGGDETVIARRHALFYDKMLAFEGKQTPDGHDVAALAISHMRDDAPIHIDVIGVGSSPYDILKHRYQTLGVNVSENAQGMTDKSGKLRFPNLRSALWWSMREALDPDNKEAIALPRDAKLRADLAAPEWKLQGPLIVVESREAIVKRIGRSPDYASAVILAQIDTPKLARLRSARVATERSDYDPYRAQGTPRTARSHNPYG